MNLSVVTPSSTQDLITLARVKARLPGASAIADADLQALITGASAAMASYRGFPFARQEYSLEFPGDGCCFLLLPPEICANPLDPDSVAATIDGVAVTLSVWDKSIGKLHLFGGWTRPSDYTSPFNSLVIWKAGYVLPGQIQTWAASLTGIALGSWIRPTSPSKSPWLFEVTTAGNAGGTEPTWPAATGQTIALGGGAIATSREAEELPAWISDLAYIEVYHRVAQPTPGLASRSIGNKSESYFATQTEGELSPAVQSGLDRLRALVA